MSGVAKNVLARALAEGCTCSYGERSLGTLYGVSMGRGTVRLTTTPECPVHDSCRGYTAAVRREYMKARPWATVGPWCPIHGGKGCP